MANFKLSPPWCSYYREVEAMFGEDSEVEVVFDDKNYVIKISVDDNSKKCNAIRKLLPAEKQFGNVTLKIEVEASGTPEDSVSLFEDAFEGNPAFSRIVSAKKGVYGDFNYILFSKEVVQYFNDDLSDPHGICSTLYQDIAKDIFGEKFGIYFCTDVDEGNSRLSKPLGEWP